MAQILLPETVVNRQQRILNCHFVNNRIVGGVMYIHHENKHTCIGVFSDKIIYKIDYNYETKICLDIITLRINKLLSQNICCGCRVCCHCL